MYINLLFLVLVGVWIEMVHLLPLAPAGPPTLVLPAGAILIAGALGLLSRIRGWRMRRGGQLLLLFGIWSLALWGVFPFMPEPVGGEPWPWQRLLPLLFWLLVHQAWYGGVRGDRHRDGLMMAIFLVPWGLLSVLETMGTVRGWAGLLALPVILAGLAPPIMARLWASRPIEEGSLAERIRALARLAGLHPPASRWWDRLDPGLPTAAVLGFVPGLRYLLLSPSLARLLSEEELAGVVLHEWGHVHYRHMLRYLVVLGAGVWSLGQALTPVLLYVLGETPLGAWLDPLDRSGGLLLGSLVGAGMVLLLFFRFVFSWFMRGFEREADGYGVTLGQDPAPLMVAFLKLRSLMGLRERRNWHHFTLGERVEYLQRLRENPSIARRHSRKMILAWMGLVLLVLALGPVARGVLQRNSRRAEARWQLRVWEGRPPAPEGGRQVWGRWHAVRALLMVWGKRQGSLPIWEKAYRLGFREPWSLRQHVGVLLRHCPEDRGAWARGVAMLGVPLGRGGDELSWQSLDAGSRLLARLGRLPQAGALAVEALVLQPNNTALCALAVALTGGGQAVRGEGPEG